MSEFSITCIVWYSVDWIFSLSSGLCCTCRAQGKGCQELRPPSHLLSNSFSEVLVTIMNEIWFLPCPYGAYCLGKKLTVYKMGQRLIVLSHGQFMLILCVSSEMHLRGTWCFGMGFSSLRVSTHIRSCVSVTPLYLESLCLGLPVKRRNKWYLLTSCGWW